MKFITISTGRMTGVDNFRYT